RRRVVRVPVEKLGTIPELVPKRDDTFIQLITEAVSGRIRVYLAGVPLTLCVPFDMDYRPDLHPVGAAAIRAIIEEAELGRVAPMIAYPRGKWFVISDDYVRLFVALQSRADYVMCWILGKPDNDRIRDIQGP